MDDLTHDSSDTSSEPPPEYPSPRRFRGVEIVDARGNPLGEFDEIVGDTLIEEKSALGVGQLHPRSRQPVQTVVQWAEKQIFQKTVVRLHNLQSAVATRSTAGGAPNVPSLGDIQRIRKLQFSIAATTPEMRSAVQAQLTRLQARFPAWEFSVIFGQ